MKEEISSIANHSDILDSISGVKFRWKDGGAYSYGVIAQEVEVLMPEAVQTNAHKSVNYNCLMAVLIEALKSQKSQIAALESTLEAVTARVTALETGSTS